MKKSLILSVAMLALTASYAAAAGINLAWTDCGGPSHQTSNCATTGAPSSMVASFMPPAGITKLQAFESQIDISALGALPEWWKHGQMQCRQVGNLQVSFDFSLNPSSCSGGDFFSGASGGFSYDVGFPTPNRARLRVAAGIAATSAAAVDAMMEYSAYRVVLLRGRTTECPGCQEPMCLVLNSIQLFQDPTIGFDPIISNPAQGNIVTWQNPARTDCPLSTPIRNSTWGQVKSLYR